MAAAEQIFESPELSSPTVSSPTPRVGSGLPLNNPFFLIIVLLANDMQVQKANLFAIAGQQQVMQNKYDEQLAAWTADTSGLTNGINNGTHNIQMNPLAMAMIGVGSALILAGIGLMVSGAIADPTSWIRVIIGAILLAVGTALLATAAKMGSDKSDNCFTQDNGVDMTGSYGLDDKGNRLKDASGNDLTLTALQQILPTDQAVLQQTQNDLSKLVQTQVGPTQDMQQQDGQMIQNALRLMQACVAQMSV